MKGLLLALVIILLFARGVAMAKSLNYELFPTSGNTPLEEAVMEQLNNLPSTKFKTKQLIAPTALIATGSLSFYLGAVKDFDLLSRSAIGVGHSKFTADDYLQFSPVFAMWAMDAVGMKPRHRLKQQTTILATSMIVTTAIVYTSKTIIGRQRPNYGAYNSFPSGHTATAFMCAEMLRQEFGHYSPWVGIAGYVAATSTAFLRVYNDRHWVTDTLAGAGVGILSTRIAYWVAPKLNKLLWGSATGYDSNVNASIAPYSYGNNYGVSLSVNF